MVTKEMIENSIEGVIRKRNIRFLLIGFTIMFMVYFGILVNSGISMKLFLPMLLLCILIFSGFVFYQWIRYRLLFSNMEAYEKYEVMLDRPTSSYYPEGSVYFTITIETKSGMRIFRKTKALWSDFFGSKYKAWEYMNAKIWIAYDEERDRLVVLGLEDDWRGTDERDYSNE